MAEDTTMKSMMGACYDCKHRGTLPGSCHSKCDHPSAAASKEAQGPLAAAMAIFAGVGRAPQPIAPEAIIDMEIMATDYGVLSGWFIFPWNFDPTWLEHCAGFETKDGLNWEQHCAKVGDDE